MHSTAMAQDASMLPSTEDTNTGQQTRLQGTSPPQPTRSHARTRPVSHSMTPCALHALHARILDDKSRKPFQPQTRTPPAAPYTPFHVDAAAAALPARGTCTHRLESQLCRHPPRKRRSSRPGYRLGPSRNDCGSRRNVLAEPGVDVDQDTCPCVSLAPSRFSPTTSPGSDALYAPGNETPLGLLVPLPVTVS
jgi:hypothetical protein